MFHLLHERHHKLSYRDLSHLWLLPTARPRAIPARYMITRVSGVCRILAQLDLVSRTSELARLFGIQFEEVCLFVTVTVTLMINAVLIWMILAKTLMKVVVKNFP